MELRWKGISFVAFLTVSVTSLFGQAVRTDADPDPIQPLSVCEVLQHRVELAGRFETISGAYKTASVQRIISVRGEVKAGGHGEYLIAEPSCTFKLTTPGRIGPNFLPVHWTWPNFIWLEYPDNKSGDESTRAPFEVDWGSMRQTERQARRNVIVPEQISSLRPSQDC